MGLRFGGIEERPNKPTDQASGAFFQNSMQVPESTFLLKVHCVNISAKFEGVIGCIGVTKWLIGLWMSHHFHSFY